MKNKFFFLPSLFTILNLFFGFLSIVQTIQGNIHTSAWYIILAVLCDGFDGKIARVTNSESQFGIELDSMADIVSSGVAPSMLVFMGGLRQFGTIGILICFFYLFGGTYRLARYNVLHKSNTKGYKGLPLPVSAFTIASLWIFTSPFGKPIVGLSWIFLIVCLTFLMISPVPFNWPKLELKKDWKKTIKSVFLLLCVLLMIVMPNKVLFPFMLSYIFYGIVHWVFFKQPVKKKQTRLK